MGYAVGMHALWVIVGEVAGVALAWAFVAARSLQIGIPLLRHGTA